MGFKSYRDYIANLQELNIKYKSKPRARLQYNQKMRASVQDCGI
jgi:hypothetical protein